MIVGLLHPGQMGAAVGARLVNAGHDVLWCPQDRSAATHDRANAAGLQPIPELAILLERAELILSICPAAAADDVARSAVDARFGGIYVDANAISPERMSAIADLMRGSTATVLDAVISGPPPSHSTTPRIYVAGPEPAAGSVGKVLSGSGFDTLVLGPQLGAASALKMATASYLRTSRALVAIAHALADEHGVTAALLREAELMGLPMLADREYLSGVAARAWRWVPEMHEIATTLADAGLPSGLAEATAIVYSELESAKNDWTIRPEQVLELLKGSDRPQSITPP